MIERLCSGLLTRVEAVSGKRRFQVRTLVRALVVAVVVLAMLAPATPARAASFTVNDLGDAPDVSAGNGACADAAGKCTLRAAIQEANALGGDDAIGFTEDLSGTISLVNGELYVDGFWWTDLAQSNNLTITGPGRDQLAVSAGGRSRVFAAKGGTLSVSDLTIADGYTEIEPWTSSGSGGAFHTGSNLILRNVTIRDNYATRGGGIYVDRQTVLTVQNSTISGNSAERGGGIWVSNNAKATVEHSTISGNTATHSGGALTIV